MTDRTGFRRGPERAGGRLRAGLPLSLLVLLNGTHAPGPLQAQEAPEDLRDLLAPGFLIQDRNGDGHADFVLARIVIPVEAGGAEVAAAANLGARLSFESYATDLDLLVRDRADAGATGGPLVVVGRAGALLAAAGIDPGRALADLVPGEGMVVRLPGSAAIPGGGVWVAGADATGLLAAGSYLASRVPGIWAPDGATFGAVGDSLVRYLEEGGVPAGTLVLERAVVSASRPGVLRLRAGLRLEDDAHVTRAREILGGADREPEEPPEPDREKPEEEAPDEAGAPAREPDPRSLLVPGLHRLDVAVVAPDGREEVHRIRPRRPWSPDDPPAWEPRDVPDFTLSDLYTIRGIYRDTRQDLVPDRTEAYLSLHGTGAAVGAVNLAQRIALETAGLRLPLVRPAGEEDAPETTGFPILFGVEHFTTRELREGDRLGMPTGVPGEGFVELVPEALGDEEDRTHALVVSGSDEAGLEAAADLVARRLPYLTENRKGEYRLSDVENEVRRFFQARGVPGQTALALFKLEQWLERLERGDRPGVPPSSGSAASDGRDEGEVPPSPEEIRVELALDSVPPGMEAHVEERVRSALPDARVAVETHPTGFGAGMPVFDQQAAFEWEVDEVRRILRDEVYSALRADPAAADRGVTVEVRVSEPPQVRLALAGEIRDSLAAAGVAGAEVRVLNAYKQGYSWVVDQLLPRLAEQRAARVEIEYHHLLESQEVRWQIIGSETRWLQELFPVEEILARELGIPDTAVVFRGTGRSDPVYRLRAWDRDGNLVLTDDFSPRYVVRPYFDLHPDYERVRVTTGWVTVVRGTGMGLGGDLGGSSPDGPATVDRTVLLDRRVPTDLERFWDFWQGSVLPRLRDYLLDLQEGDPTMANAPFFDELRIDVRLSEPNHRIGVDEEVISSLESLHNDLYFHTLAFLGHLGQHYERGSLGYVGRILPHIDPTGDGEPGWARAVLAGRERASPELVVRTRPSAAGDDEWGRWRYPLQPLPTEAPKLRGISVRAGSRDLDRLLFDVVARDSVDRYDEHRERASEGAVDRAFLSVEMLEGMVGWARELHARGILERGLAFRGVGELAFRFLVEDEDDFRRVAVLPRSPRPLSTENPVLAAPDFRHRGEPLVQWNAPVPPPENDSILARLATFPEATVYFMGRSYLGRNIFAADFLPPVEAELRSQAKLNALRPTAFFSGRQHANEVSSTSHLLRLGELLVTDPEYRALLERVNVVIHPVTNPDGAQLAVDMQEVNPDFTLHAGYLGALGVDVTAGAGSDDPIYPESRVRPELMATWLPDIYINMHGYPSHEWVQHFSGYAAWVRGRTVTSRTWWAPRGWFIPGFSWVDDPDHPEIRTAQFAILDTLAAAITGEPEVQAMSERQYARYARYGRQDVEGFREQFHEGMLVYLALRGRPATGSGPSNPRINTFSATTEAPDETARGEWLELVATAGLAHSSALVRYLATGVNRVERRSRDFGESVTREVFRTRPVLPPEEGEREEGEESEKPNEGKSAEPGASPEGAILEE